MPFNNNSRRRRLALFLLLNFLLLGASLLWYGGQQTGSVTLAVAKNKQFYDMTAMGAIRLDETAVYATALANPELNRLIAGKEVDFLNAIPLTAGESRHWQDQGCDGRNCAHLILYNYTDGGTINAILNYETNTLVGEWTDAAARPAGSEFILDKAVAIAAKEPQVTAVLGDIGDADPAMIPMSAWLGDDACRDDWCVDLSFHDPNGTGRVFHVFVNMESETVARTFYTRGRADVPALAPEPQRTAYSDGCHEQYGWEVCWEMTAHDGVNFQNATYNGTAVFESIKIGQVEAWYPSWPGGYRDEIGFRASVPPFGDTQLTDLGDGFEVRQLFTEFTRWPNCICCYRYEQVLQFYDDGRFLPRFVSHGPGCDDLSVYRPFWRIDLTLDGRDGDEVWFYENSQWRPIELEGEIHPFVEDLSPDGDKLATFDGDTHYRWRMERTDPLGLDEAYLFFLQYKEGEEGDGPVVTGPGDTYQPPRQWIDGELLSGSDPVIWFVPLLKTKKSNPYWCMPDPEPGINQCEAILHIEPGIELHQPTAEELAAIPTPTPTAVPPTPDTAHTPTPEPTAIPRAVEGETPEEIILNAGCGICHQIGDLGESRKVGPDLSNIGNEAAERIPGFTAEEYLRQAILNPNATMAPECPNAPCQPNIMPQDYDTRLTAVQLDTMIAFLLEQKSGDAAPSISPDGTAETISPTAKAQPTAKMLPMPNNISQTNLTIQLMLIVVVSIFTIFLLWKTSRD